MWMYILNKIIYQVKYVFFLRKFEPWKKSQIHRNEKTSHSLLRCPSHLPGGTVHRSVDSNEMLWDDWLYWTLWWLGFPTNYKDMIKILIWADWIRKVCAEIFSFKKMKDFFKKMANFKFFRFLRFFLTKILGVFIFVPNWQVDRWLHYDFLGYRSLVYFRADW